MKHNKSSSKSQPKLSSSKTKPGKKANALDTLKAKVQISKKRLRIRYAIIALVSVAMVCIVLISLYISSLLDKPTHTDIPIVTGGEVSEGILDNLPDPDEMDTSEYSSDSSSNSSVSGPEDIPYANARWGNGRVKLYVNSSFPITFVEQKDPNVENILLIGIDARSAYEKESRTDSILIVTVDRNNNSIKLTSIMRDTQVKIPGRTHETKINAAYVYGGVGLLINTINLNFDLDIQKVAMVDMLSAETVIDAAGGVTINVTKSEFNYVNEGVTATNNLFKNFSAFSPYLTKSGEQLLNGRQAVAYGRIRYIGTDTARTQRQRTVLSALIVSFKSASFSRKMSVFETCLQSFETNITKSDLLFLSFDVLSGMRNIQQYRVPQDGMYTTNLSNYQLVVNYANQIPALHQFIWGTGSGAVITMPANESNPSSEESAVSGDESSTDSEESSLDESSDPLDITSGSESGLSEDSSDSADSSSSS